MKTSIILLSLLLVTAGVSAETIRIPDQYATIQEGIDAAEAGDEVLVAAGTYNDCTHEYQNDTSMLHCIIMKSGVALIGESGSASTTIDAQELGRVVRADSCEAGTRIEGFTITGGKTSSSYGAGLRCYNSNIEFVDVVFTDNETTGNGGGASVVRGTNRFTNCIFSNNRANHYYGGGIYCISTNSVFENCRFTGNSSKHGGGIVCDFSSGHPTFIRCLIDHNRADRGGGIWTSNRSQVRFEYCTITDNEGSYAASYYSLTSRPTFYCCILSFGEGPAMHCPEGVEFECCEIYGHTGGDEITGTDIGGCFSLDPLFVNRLAGDYNLQGASPCQTGNHPAGCNDEVIGAFPPDATPIQRTTWGGIKAMFR